MNDELMVYNIQLCGHTDDSTQRRLCKWAGKWAANGRKTKTIVHYSFAKITNRIACKNGIGTHLENNTTSYTTYLFFKIKETTQRTTTINLHSSHTTGHRRNMSNTEILKQYRHVFFSSFFLCRFHSRSTTKHSHRDQDPTTHLFSCACTLPVAS